MSTGGGAQWRMTRIEEQKRHEGSKVEGRSLFTIGTCDLVGFEVVAFACRLHIFYVYGYGVSLARKVV